MNACRCVCLWGGALRAGFRQETTTTGASKMETGLDSTNGKAFHGCLEALRNICVSCHDSPRQLSRYSVTTDTDYRDNCHTTRAGGFQWMVCQAETHKKPWVYTALRLPFLQVEVGDNAILAHRAPSMSWDLDEKKWRRAGHRVVPLWPARRQTLSAPYA